MYSPSFTTRFKKDFKLCKKRDLDLSQLEDVMNSIIEGEKLSPKYKAHLLSGNFSDCTECHVSPDWLLIYILNDGFKRVEFVRTGTHADLFGK